MILIQNDRRFITHSPTISTETPNSGCAKAPPTTHPLTTALLYTTQCSVLNKCVGWNKPISMLVRNIFRFHR